MDKKFFAVVCIVSAVILMYIEYTKTLAIGNLKYFSATPPGKFQNSQSNSQVTVLENISNTKDAGLESGDSVIQNSLLQNDPELTKLILSGGILHPPPTPEISYNLSTPATDDPSQGQSDVVKKIFNNMTNGFFVECGALDGETRSNTLSLERDFNWTGLLIEGGPSNFKLVQTKHRKAWTANCCLAIHPYPHKVMYHEEFNVGKISSDNFTKLEANTANVERENNSVPVECFPIFALLSALNVTTVDYFSLDVEGHELEILKTIPFDLVYIKVLSVEYYHGTEGTSAMKTFMESKGYSVVTRVVEFHNRANDFIFAHKNVSVTDEFPPEIQNFDRSYQPRFRTTGRGRKKKPRRKKPLSRTKV